MSILRSSVPAVIVCTVLVAFRTDAHAIAKDSASARAWSPGQSGESQSDSSVDETRFTLSIAPRGKIGRGKSGEVVVALTAKAPYHVNNAYPHRFSIRAKRGLNTPSDTIKRDPAKVTPDRLELAIPVTLTKVGPFGLDGELSFSICTDDHCEMVKRALTVTIAAK